VAVAGIVFVAMNAGVLLSRNFAPLGHFEQQRHDRRHGTSPGCRDPSAC
jgi:hypothetical protein